MHRSLSVRAALSVIAVCAIFLVHTLFSGRTAYTIKTASQQKGSLLGVDPFFDFSAALLNEKSLPAESTASSFQTMRVANWIGEDVQSRCRAHFRRYVVGRRVFSTITSSVLSVVADRKWYRRFHLMKLIAMPREKIASSLLYAVLYKNGKMVSGAGGAFFFPFVRRNGHLVATLNRGFVPHVGRYVARVFSTALPRAASVVVPLEIRARKRRPVPRGFSVMTLESAIPMRYQKMRDPYGKSSNYQALFKWAKLLGADAFWILGSQASGKDRGISFRNPFCSVTLDNVALLGRASRAHGIDLGAYIISYYTPHRGMDKAGYAPSMRYVPGSDQFVVSEHTSLVSKKRLHDLVRFARLMQKNSDVKYVGFDFIRTGHADGFEMVELVVDEMNIVVPAVWSTYSKREKMRWFARKVLVAKDRSLIDRWRWWRAHRVASIINTVIRLSGLKKPVWVFTLGWEHGKQHGQDPYMMLDAGCFVDAAMLYEASAIQFDAMMKQWRGYIDSRTTSIVTGNCVDYKLNPSSKRAPLEEFYRRSMAGFTGFSNNGNAKGIFWHDVGRAIWGRTGENSGSEWAIVGGSAATRVREMSGFFPFSLTVPRVRRVRANSRGMLTVVLHNRSGKELRNIKLQLLPGRVFRAADSFVKIVSLPAYAKKRISFPVRYLSRVRFAAVNAYAVRVFMGGVRHYLKHGFIRLISDY